MKKQKILGYSFSMYDFELSYLMVKRYNKFAKDWDEKHCMRIVKELIDNCMKDGDTDGTYCATAGFIVFRRGADASGIVKMHINFDPMCATDSLGIPYRFQRPEDNVIIYANAAIEAE